LAIGLLTDPLISSANDILTFGPGIAIRQSRGVLGSEAPKASSYACDLIAAVGLRGGSKVTVGLSVRGMASVAVRDRRDGLLLGIMAIGVHRLLPGSSHTMSPTFIRLMAQSTRSGSMLKIQTSRSVQC
jgi:hypothetical protein